MARGGAPAARRAGALTSVPRLVTPRATRPWAKPEPRARPRAFQRPWLLRARCRRGPCHRLGGPAVIHERCCTPSLAPWNQAMANKHEFELLLL